MPSEWLQPSSEAKRMVATETLGLMLQALETDGTNVIFKGPLAFEGLVPALAELLKFPPHWTGDERGSTVRRAVLNIKKAEKSGFDDFLDELRLCSDKLMKAELAKYRLWTKISVENLPPKIRVSMTIASNKVSIHNRIPRVLKVSKRSLSGFGSIDPSYPDGGVIAVATGQFRSDNQAGHGLNASISDVVSIINFAYRKHWSEWNSGKSQPRSKVLMGDNQFLFKEDGPSETAPHWYNPDFSLERWKQRKLRYNELDNLLPYIRWTLRKIDKLSFGVVVLAAVRMMASGMNSHNPSHRIWRTWTALEVLLSRNKDRADRTEDLIRRAVFIAKDRRAWTTKLKQANSARNMFVHKEEGSIESDAVSNSLDALFCTLVQWTLVHGSALESHSEFIDFLDLPPGLEQLQRQIKIRKLASDILTEKTTP